MNLKVDAQNGSYDIRIGPGLIRGDFFKEYSEYAVVTDANVAPLYAKGFSSERLIVLPPGESSKTLANYEKILDWLSALRMSRHGTVIALGGGVVGDIAGFAAATYKRGVKFVQVPTTLLAQVDSSVGGKVAVNLAGGKNLAGAFYQPGLVLADTETLSTLPAREYAAGMAEVIKYAYIADAELHEQLRQKDIEIADVIRRCCAIKAGYVERDPFDVGVRMELNYGHTLGHAIETAAGYGYYLHGEAVALGMVCAARIGEALGVSPAGLEKDTVELLKRYDLPYRAEPALLGRATQFLQADKKADGEGIQFVLVDRIGRALLRKMTTGDIAAVLKGNPA